MMMIIMLLRMIMIIILMIVVIVVVVVVVVASRGHLRPDGDGGHQADPPGRLCRLHLYSYVTLYYV